MSDLVQTNRSKEHKTRHLEEHSPEQTPLASPYAGILALQRSAGNRAVSQLVQSEIDDGEPGENRLPAVVSDVLNSPGQPLDPETRNFMGSRFNYDFGHVRIHTDARAGSSASALNSRAYTLKNDIVFGHGEYAPGTVSGRSLVAHELAHVVQQQGTPSAVQKKPRLGSPSDSAEQAADAASRAVMAGSTSPDNSPALKLRDTLRTSTLSHPVIQRAVKTWGGEYDTDKYKLTKNPGMDGVDIELRFKPNKHVDAELIGMTQTVRMREKGVPFAIGSGKEKKALESRMIPAGKAEAGTMIDQLARFRSPLYATGKTSPKDTLATTPTSAIWGQHGWRYTDKAGKLQKRDALLKDTPQLLSTRKESSQVFETTALAVKGAQEGTFYGSVQWGWEKDATGKIKKLPLTLVSKDVPSSAFARATELWNKAKTSKGKETIDLPIVVGKYTNTPGVWLVRNPSKYKTTIIGKLAKNTRLEVTNKGEKQRFNRTTDKYKWWKVTVVDGTHIGKVGWVMQTLLSDKKTK